MCSYLFDILVSEILAYENVDHLMKMRGEAKYLICIKGNFSLPDISI